MISTWMKLGTLATLASLTALACAPTGDTLSDEASMVDDAALKNALCQSAEPGLYCGNDMMTGADANTLYYCPGKGMAPTQGTICGGSCVTAAAGTADYCSSAPAPTTNPTCLGSQPGLYCGNDAMSGADANTLYNCPGAGMAPTQATPCANGCITAAAGTADYCKQGSNGGGTSSGYRLPWHGGNTVYLTQDCNDSCCNDHVGNDKYAWDFAGAGNSNFTVVAARGGTITHLKINSTSGCGAKTCVNDANFIVIDHGDGTQSTYLHLEGNSLKSGIYCGATVTQGQELARAGTTGWSTANHLHYEVSKSHPGAATCECGANGDGCATDYVPWSSFWPNSSYPTVAVAFDEWQGASSCTTLGNNDYVTMPNSMN